MISPAPRPGLPAMLVTALTAAACFGSSVSPILEESDTLRVVRADTLGAPAGDPVTIGNAAVIADGTRLEVTVNYAGGCKLHSLDLRWDGALHITETDTITANLALVHEDNGDTCEALVIETQDWKLEPVLSAVSQLARPSPVVLSLDLRDWSGALVVER